MLRSPRARRVAAWLRALRATEPRARTTFLRLQLARALGLRRDRVPAGARRIVFVCHGNIMRSPMGELLLRDELARRGLTAPHVSSAGIHARDGKEADPRARTGAARLGHSLDAHRATLLTREIVDAADLLLVMDWKNEAELVHRFPDAARRTALLGAWAPPDPATGIVLPDPYMGGADAVDACYARLAPAVARVAELLVPTASGTTAGVPATHASRD